MFEKNNTDEIAEISLSPPRHPEDKPSKFTIPVGEEALHVYCRDRSPFYWCGFHFRGKYIRVSTKETSPTQARAFALKWHWQQRLRIEAGTLKVGGVTFAKAAQQALEGYRAKTDRGDRSKHYLRGLEMCLSARVLPFFKDIPVNQIDSKTWADYKEHAYKDRPDSSSRATLHQHKNAVRIVLNEAHKKGWLAQVPVFKDDYNSQGQSKPRTWFEPAEYQRLYKATRANIALLRKTRHAEAAKELHDYVIFVANTGLRIGEANNVRFCDVDILKTLDESGIQRQVLLIKNILGKRGTGECKSHFGAVDAYKRIVARRKPEPGSQERLFLKHHRDMFNTVLKRTGLKVSPGQPPARRDLMSLRHTYMCFRLLKGASVFDVAANCRTSVTMVQRHYAQYLQPRMSTTINRELNGAGFGSEGKP